MQQKIRQFILTNFLFTEDESLLRNDASLLEEGVLDSTGVLELVAFVESEFGIKVADEELVPEHLDSVASIVAFIGVKQQAAREMVSA